MTEKIIEIEAETLEEAREQIKSQIPESLRLLSEQVISDGKPKTVKAVGDTTEMAFAKAKSEVPANAVITEKKEVASPVQKTMTVEAFDEQSARTKLESQIGNTAVIKAIKLAMAGKKGFLGIGNKPNRYEADVFQQAVVEITHKTKAKICAEVGEKKSTRDELIAVTKEKSKEMTKKINVSEYLGKGGFNSVKEIEASFFMALLFDLTGSSLKDEDIIYLVMEHYGLDDFTARKNLKLFKASRGFH